MILKSFGESEPVTTAAVLEETVRAHASASGGWGYYAGKSSRIEPTCWALLAGAARAQDSAAPHGTFLQRCQRADGLLADNPVQTPNYASNALALLALAARTDLHGVDASHRIHTRMLDDEGVRTGPMPGSNQDNMLRGWPWIEGTFSWVEPTSLCLLALKRTRALAPADARVAERIAQAELLLVNRCCEGGGWNYGNAEVLGTKLYAYTPTTALGLLALQDRRELPEVQESLAFLERHATVEQSGTALALALLCLRVYRRPAGHVEAALVAQWTRTHFLGNLCTTAMALCALTADHTGQGPFTLS